jgi:DnaJ like chaperone protein
MNVWGKIGGAGLGGLIGGALGAVIGAVAGHLVVDRDGGLFGTPPRDVIFATGLVALCAKMAKADGVVTHDEVKAFRRVIDVPDEDLDKVRRLFDLAQRSSAGFEAYAEQIAAAFRDDRPLLESILDGLFHIAKADHAIHEAETRYLNAVAVRFGLSEQEFADLEARHVARPDDPYAMLGAERGMSDAAQKALYRRRVADNHPDHLIARGMPPEAIRIANARLAAINTAWERIARERALAQSPA